MEKKISVVHPFFTQYGGAEKVVLDMAKHFVDKYGECNLYTSVFDKSFEKTVRGVKDLNIIALKRKVVGKAIFGDKFNPFLLVDMLRLSRKIKKSDFIITTNWPSNIPVYLSKRFFNNKTTPSFFFCFEPDHGLHHKEMMTSQYVSNDYIKLKLISIIFFPFRLLDKFIVNQEKIILTLSEYVKQKIKVVFGNASHNKTFPILHDYIDTKRIIIKKPKRNLITFFSLCRLEKSKNVNMIITAFKMLQNKNKNTKLLIGGTGPEETRLKKLAESTKTIKFLGFVKDKELSNYYVNADIFVFAGTRESAGPLTLIQAMAYGKACIAPDDGGSIEIIENGKDGIFFKAHSTNSLYKKMKHLSENKNKRKVLGINARKKALASYSAKHFFSVVDTVIEHPEKFLFRIA
ncbi:glycosyltransferase family 4 protein [Candidatus Woesearchaeota archaeon]|nr:glycosyltransferase family 4 protein [Candidatus Woesearchaeota archaeon]